MSDTPGPRERPSADDLLRRALAGQDRRARGKALAALARRVGRGPRAAEVLSHLTNHGGPGAGLAFVARVRGRLPAALVPAAVDLLRVDSIPTRVRLAAAGKLLAAVPDTPEGVRPVLAAVTAGQSPTKALERLIRLQSRVARCDTLDRAVAATEARVPLSCPACQAKLPRTGLVRHLWDKHRLVYDRGQVRDPRALLDAAMTARGAPTRSPAARTSADPVERAFALTSLYFPGVPPRQVFQALAARGSAHPTYLEPLLLRAAEDRCGLCPGCLSALPDPVPALLPPLALGGGRLAGEGYAVDVVDGPLGRTVGVTTRDGVVPDAAPRRFGPRVWATLAGTAVVLLGGGLTLIMPGRTAPPLAVAGLFAVAGGMAYLSARLLRPPLPDADAVAVDRAWADVVPGIGRKPAAVRFLTRLARTSLGVGSADDRVDDVRDLVEQAAVIADRGGISLQLLAVARVLEVTDGAVRGREKVAGLAGVFDPFLRGELPAAYAEAAAEAVLTSGVLASGEGERLAVLLLGTAFDVGWAPADIAGVARFLPSFRRLLGEPSAAHLKALAVVWRWRTPARWANVGTADAVFDLARSSPVAAKKALSAFPDALLRVDLGPDAEKELGPVLVCSGGVVAGGAVVADPDVPVEVVKGRVGWELHFGSHRIGLDRKLSADVAAELRAWVRFRARVLLPAADAFDGRPTAAPRFAGVLAPLVVRCPLCATDSVVRTGQLGVRWPDVAGG